MSTLSDLLPAGSGGKQVNFVASGALSNGQTVGLKSDGTVETITTSTVAESMGSPVTTYFETGINASTIIQTKYSSCYDSLANRLVVVFIDKEPSSSTYFDLRYAIGTISGSSISFGTTGSVGNGQSPEFYTVSCVFHAGLGKAFLVFQQKIGASGIQMQTKLCTVNAATNTATFVGAFDFNANSQYWSTNNSLIGLVYDSVNETIVVCAKDVNTSNYTLAIANSNVGGNSWGTYQVINTSPIINNDSIAMCFDSTNNKIVIALFYSYQLHTIVVTAISATPPGKASLSIGTTVTQPNLDGANGFDLLYDSAKDRVVCFSQDSNLIKYNNGVISGSGTSAVITWATPGNVNAFSALWGTSGRAVYDSSTGEFAVIYLANSGSVPYYSIGRVDASNPNICTFNSPVSFNTSPAGSIESVTMAVNTTETGRIGCFYRDLSTNPSTGYVFGGASTVLTIGSSSTTNINFIGITDEAIADTATGSVTIKGGIVTNANLPTLTPNSVYYVQGNGTISTTSTSPAIRIGKALSSTSINLEFNS